jgi:hypothetical protein
MLITSPVLCALEAARGQDHSLLGPDPQRSTLLLDDGADDAAIFADQVAGGRVQPQGDLALHQREPQHPDQGVAHGQVPVALRPEPEGDVEGILEHQLEEEPHPAGLPGQHRLRLDGGHREPPHHLHLEVLLAHEQEVVAQLAGVEVRRLDRSTAGLAAGDARVVVGIRGLGHELRVRAVGEPLEHQRCVVAVGLQPIVGHDAGGRPLEVLPGLFGAVVDSDAGHQVIVGDPQQARPHGRGAAVAVGLLDQERAAASIVRPQRGRHGAGSGPDDQHVDFVVPGSRVGVRHDSPSSSARTLRRKSFPVSL